MATNFGYARPIDLLEMPNNAQSFSQMMNAYNQMSRLLMQQNRPVGGGGGGGGGSRTSTSGYWVADPTSPEGRRWISTAGSTDKARTGAETTGLQTLAADILRNDSSIQEKLGKLSSLDVNSQEKLLDDIRQNDLPRLSQSTNVPIGELLTAALKPYATAVEERARAVEDDGIGNILWEAAKAGTKTMWDSLSSVFAEEDAAAKLQRGQDAANYWKQARENSAYLKDQYLRESAGEGFLDRADSLSDFITNVGVAAAENLGTMGATMGAAAAGAKTGAAVGSLIPGLGTAAGATIGAILGGATANAPAVTGEFYQRLAEDPNLTEAQKLQAIEEYGTTVGALGAATGGLAGPIGTGITKVAGNIIGPRLASRVANQAVKRELAKGATQEAAEQAGKKAAEAYSARLARGGVRNFVTRDLPNEFVPNAVEGLSELITQNAVYNQATGQSLPIASGLSEVLGAALGFGVPVAARRNWTRNRWYAPPTQPPLEGPPDNPARRLRNQLQANDKFYSDAYGAMSNYWRSGSTTVDLTPPRGPRYTTQPDAQYPREPFRIWMFTKDRDAATPPPQPQSWTDVDFYEYRALPRIANALPPRFEESTTIPMGSRTVYEGAIPQPRSGTSSYALDVATGGTPPMTMQQANSTFHYYDPIEQPAGTPRPAIPQLWTNVGFSEAEALPRRNVAGALPPRYEGPIPQPPAAPSGPAPKTVKQLQKLVITKNFKRDFTNWQKDTPGDSTRLTELVNNYITTARGKGYSDEVISDTLNRMATTFETGAVRGGNTARKGTGGEASTTPTVGRVGQGGADELASADITVNRGVETDTRSDAATIADSTPAQVAGDNRAAESGGPSGAGVQGQRANQAAQVDGQQVGAGPAGTPDNGSTGGQPAPRTAEPDQGAGVTVNQRVGDAGPAGDAAPAGASPQPSGPITQRRRAKATGNVAKDIQQSNTERGGVITKKTQEVLKKVEAGTKKPVAAKPKKTKVKSSNTSLMSDLDELRAAFSAAVDASADELARIKARQAEAALFPRDVPLAEDVDDLPGVTSYGPNNERGYKSAEENPTNFPDSNNCRF